MSDESRYSMRPRLRALARRYGLKPRRAVVAAAVVIVAGVAVASAFGMGGAGGVEITRAEQVQPTLTPSAEAAESEKKTAEHNAEESAEGRSVPEVTRMVIHVDGAVVAPGVYVLEQENPRVNDVVVRAGGLTTEADTTTVNLAAPVTDGQKVHIPLVGEAPGAVDGSVGVATSNPVDQNAVGTNSGLVNINTASTVELCELPGVGEVTAAAIVEEREANGPFVSADDLVRVTGIGEKKLAKLREYVCV